MDHQHASWTSVLSEHAMDDGFRYEALHHSRGGLDEYLAQLADVQTTDSWTRSERLAYWVNAYNAYTIDLVLANYPLTSVRDIGPFRSWGFLKPVVRVPGRRIRINLYALEHWILRRRFSEPRIHFAINCASVSCPVLAPQAYRASDLDEQLERAATEFIRDPRRNRIDPATDSFQLSALFRWFRRDFGGTEAAVRAYVARYLPGETAAWVKESEPSLDYLEYDWSLNDQP